MLPNNFRGACLVEAREAHDMTATALAGALGVTKAAVSQYEHDRQKPRPEVMQKICDVFQLPAAFFAREERSGPLKPSFYRSQQKASDRARRRAERRQAWVADIAAYVESFIDMPAPDLPDFQIRDPLALTPQDIESMAADVRAHWGLGDGPISNVTWCLENHGVIVSRWSLGSPDRMDMDAFSRAGGKAGERDHVVLGRDKNVCVRSRLDVGHELGHLVLHRSIDDKSKVAEFHQKIEKDAFTFGSAFLLPSESFVGELQSVSLNAFLDLKERWKVSVAAMIERAHRLGLMNDHRHTKLRILLNQRGWRTAEPLDDTLPVETPQMLASSLKLLVDSNVQTKRQIKAALPFGAHNIEEFTGLDRAFLEDQAPVQRAPTPQVRAEFGGHVIPFPGAMEA